MPRGGCSEDESLPVESRGTERSFVSSERSKIIMAQIDPNSPTYAKLSRYAARVETLLKKAAVKGKPGLVASLDDFLGILYSLFFAREYDFTDRLDRKIDPTAVEKRAHEQGVENAEKVIQRGD